jgi:hypothetical protein
MMSTICFRKSTSVLMLLLAVSLAMIGLGVTASTAVAQEKDSLSDRSADTLELKLGDEKEKVTLSIKTGGEKKELTKEIIISKDGVILNGKKLNLAQLADSAQVSISIEGGSIARFGEPIVIAEDEVVDGDVFSFGGHVTVAGTVTGDVAVIGANLQLRPTGVIKGDVFTLGGTIHQEPGSQIRGQRAGVLPENFHIYTPFIIHPLTNLITFGLPLLFFIIISFLFIALAGFFAPRHIEQIATAIEAKPLKSILLGFAAMVAFLPLFLLLCVTIIGIPAALILQPIAYFVAGIMGFAGVSSFVATKLQHGSRASLTTPISKILLGALIIEGSLILAWLFTLLGRSFAPLFWLFYLIGWIIFLVASMAGLGAVIWTRFGLRPPVSTGDSAPLAPPFAETDPKGHPPGPSAAA